MKYDRELDEKTRIGGVFLNEEEATRLFIAAKAFDELILTSDELMSTGVPTHTLQLINQELRFVLGADQNAAFEFQSDSEGKIEHLREQKTRLEAAIHALE